MDIIDVVVTIAIIAVVIGSEVVKIKKKIASVSPPKNVREFDDGEEKFEPIEAPFFEDRKFVKNENFNPKSSKSMSYFTYEDVPEVEAVDLETMAENPSLTPTNQIQEIENETEALNIDLNNVEELKKAIIYGEILKNPYN